MENMVNDSTKSPDSSFWSGKRVFMTGHTGFKGGWLTLWLNMLGAKVYGYALQPPTTPNLFETANIGERLETDTRADLADLDSLVVAMRKAVPDVVFHLAAQPLVRESYRYPVETFRTNVMGTAHVLEVVRQTQSVHAVVIVTTDKVYENTKSERPFREHDSLGGHDPYSASKAAAEIVTAGYRRSYFESSDRERARIATGRSGNVIGGGDWGCDRLIPDCLRAFAKGEPVRLRYPDAIRPWQHVLEPLCGYLLLAERLHGDDGSNFAEAWNFGPGPGAVYTVEQVTRMVAGMWGKDARVEVENKSADLHETGCLTLDAQKARNRLGWRSCWSLEQALTATVRWHRAWLNNVDMSDFMMAQIRDYCSVITA